MLQFWVIKKLMVEVLLTNVFKAQYFVVMTSDSQAHNAALWLEVLTFRIFSFYPTAQEWLFITLPG